MPSDVRASYACALVGGGASALTFAMGAENLVNVVAGGVVAPASPGILILGVTGVVFATFCTVGQALTPAAVDLAERVSGATQALEADGVAMMSRARDAVAPLGALAAEQTDGMVSAVERALQNGLRAAGSGCAQVAMCEQLLSILYGNEQGVRTAPGIIN